MDSFPLSGRREEALENAADRWNETGPASSSWTLLGRVTVSRAARLLIASAYRAAPRDL